jgi:hypothetical protein
MKSDRNGALIRGFTRTISSVTPSSPRTTGDNGDALISVPCRAIKRDGNYKVRQQTGRRIVPNEPLIGPIRFGLRTDENAAGYQPFR